MSQQADPAAAAAVQPDETKSNMPDGPNVGPSAQEHLAAQGVLPSPAAQGEGMKILKPTEAQLDDAIENSFPASDPIATTSQKTAS